MSVGSWGIMIKWGGMTVQGKGKIGKNQRKIGDTGCNPDTPVVWGHQVDRE